MKAVGPGGPVNAAIQQRPSPSAELEALFVTHHARVLKAAFRITGSMADAEDIAQALFLRIAADPEGPRMQNPGSYLYRAAINAALDLLRRRKTEGAVEIEETHSVCLPVDCEVWERRKWLRSALASLSPRAAEIFVLRYIEECDNREIAQAMGISRAGVAVTLARTRARLRKQYQQQSGGKR
jgi:RNA polymerase sigma-70 factor (ECF subfamily)